MSDNYCGEMAGSGSLTLQISAWITARAFGEYSQIALCLQHCAAFSFITLQTRMAAWSYLDFPHWETSSLSHMTPPNPLQSRIYPSLPAPAHLYLCSFAHKHSMMPVVITAGHDFRDNSKTIYYAWSIRNQGQAFSG